MKKHAKPSKSVGASPEASATALGGGNEAALASSGLGGEEKKGSWLSRAWGGMKDVGASMGYGAKNAGKVGAGIGALPTGIVGGALGGAVGAVGGKKGAMTGGKILGGLLALPGALVGGLIGGVAGGVTGLVDEITYDEKGLLESTAEIPGYHVILEQMAHKYAYGKGDLGTLDAWGYELAAEHEDKNSGFRVVAFSPKSPDAVDPDGKPLKPVVAFRGTCNAGGALDDLNREGIGTFQFSRNEKETEQVLMAAKGGSAPDVTGHSLGGALAQLAAARFGGLVGNIVTFQAAGIGGAEAQRIDKDAHQATHYRAGGDLVHSGGEGFAAGKVVQLNHKGIDTALSHMTFPLAELNALRGKSKSNLPVVPGARGQEDEWVQDEGGGYHEGHWKDAEAQTKSHLHKAKHFHDSNNASHSGIVDMIGGQKNAGKFMKKLASLTGASNRQEVYAKAWRDIRAVVMNIKSPDEIPALRSRVVDLCLQHEIEPRDHGKFISQAEAAMLDALERPQRELMAAPK